MMARIDRAARGLSFSCTGSRVLFACEMARNPRSSAQQIRGPEDPIGLAGGLNLYGFANGDPVNFSDPFGLKACDPPDDPSCTGGEASTASEAAGKVVDFLESLPGKAVSLLAEGVGAFGRILSSVVPGVGNAAAAATGIDPEGNRLGNLARAAAVGAAVTEVVLTRPTPGGDGGISRHVLEKVGGRTNRVIHQVERAGGIVHQHTTHVGKYGGLRRFPDKWTGIPTIKR